MPVDCRPTALAESIVRVNNNTAPGWTGGFRTDYNLREGTKEMTFQGSCFGGLTGHIKANGFDPQKTTLIHVPPVGEVLTEKQKFRWIELCQTIGIIPKDQTPQEIVRRGLSVFLGDDNLSPFDFYMRVAFCRYMKEVPRLVENVLDLVDNGGADFWAAYTFSHDLNVKNSAHSLVEIGAYGLSPGRENLGLVLSLHRITRKLDRPDKRIFWKELKDHDPGRTVFHWKTHKSSMELSFGLDVKLDITNREEILNPRLIPLFQSEDKEDFLERLENLKEENPNVKFKVPGSPASGVHAITPVAAVAVPEAAVAAPAQ